VLRNEANFGFGTLAMTIANRRSAQPQAARTAAATERAMSQVTVTINNRQYRMACEDGQESHLLKLGEELDKRIVELRGKFGEIGDARLTVMAALTVADALADAEQRLHQLEQELTAQRKARALATDRADKAEVAMTAALNAAAERIESLAKQLGSEPVPGNGIAIG
jgi:cell division protein ZapA